MLKVSNLNNKRFLKNRLLFFVLICFVILCIIVIINISFGQAIKNEFYNECPEYNMEKSIFKKTDIVRDWVFNEVVWADSRNTLVTYSNRFWQGIRKINLENVVLFNELYLEKTKFGGFFCYDTSLTLAEMYNLLGYESCIADFAIFDNDKVVNSHVITLVKINTDWFVQDATFNLTYENQERERLSINDIQKLLEKNEVTEIKQLLSDDQERLFVAINDKNKAYLYSKNMTQYQESFTSLFPYFSKDGYIQDALYLFLYPFNVSGHNRNWPKKDEIPEID